MRGGHSPTSTSATAGRCTSPTPCAAASTSTTGAWRSCTRRKRPTGVRELEAWGAVFDRTKDGRILQRNFGGHRYPRLAHVGDRTGLEMIRTLQDHGIHQGIDVHMECTVVSLLKDGGRVVGRLRLRPRARALQRLQGEGDRARDRRHRPRLQDHEQQLGVHRRRPHARVRRRRRPDGHGVRAVPPDRHGLAAERAGHPGDRRACAARAASCATRKAAASCSTTSPRTTRARPPDNEEEGWRYTQGDKNARRPPELLTRDHVARCIMREVKAGRGSPHGGVFLDIAWIKARLPNARRAHQAQAAEHVPPVQAARRHRHHDGADGGRADDALRHGRRARRRRHADVDACRASSRRASARPGSTARTASAATRSPTCWCSASAPASTRRSSRRRTPPAGSDDGAVEAAARAGQSRSFEGDSAENPYKIQQDLQG